DTDNSKAKEATKTSYGLLWSGLVPKPAGLFGRFIYTEWIGGDTVEKVSQQRKLSDTEIENIVKAWMRARLFNGRPYDLHSGNIMYRNNDKPDFVIVDGLSYKRDLPPALMVSELFKHYSFGTPEGRNTVLKGIASVLKPADLWEFLTEALLNRIKVPMSKDQLQTIKDCLVRTYDLRGPPLESYLAARIINNALHPQPINEELPAQPIDSLLGRNIDDVTANSYFATIPWKMFLNKILQYHRDPKGMTWEEYSKDIRSREELSQKVSSKDMPSREDANLVHALLVEPRIPALKNNPQGMDEAMFSQNDNEPVGSSFVGSAVNVGKAQVIAYDDSATIGYWAKKGAV
ncbi:MAG: hypothetical protein ABSA33_07095, partial [Candidatus Micrarchaeaceae archaeon]